jgi:hypothetical protein
MLRYVQMSEITLLKFIKIMPCGCKNKQPQAAPKTESVIKRTRPSGGVRGMRTEKRIIR